MSSSNSSTIGLPDRAKPGSQIIRYLVYVLLIFTPLARGSELPWALTIIHLITLLGLTVVLIQRALAWNWRLPKTTMNKALAVLLVLTFVAACFSKIPWFSLWAAVLCLDYVILFYLVIETVTTRAQLRQLVYVVMGISVVLTVLGLLKLSGNNPFAWWNYAASTLNRDMAASSSTFNNPNRFAGYLEMALPLTLGMLFAGYKGGQRILIVYLALMMLVMLVFTRSRGAWLSTVVSLVLVALLYIRHYPQHRFNFMTALTAGLILIGLVVLSDKNVVADFKSLKSVSTDVSFVSRIGLWDDLARMIGEHPLLGTGPGTFGVMFTQHQPMGFNVRFYRAHNDYLQFITELGLFIGVVYIWLIYLFFKRGLKKFKHPSRLVRGTTLGAMSGVTAMLIHSMFDFNLRIPANAILFTVLVAIVIARSPRSLTS